MGAAGARFGRNFPDAFTRPQPEPALLEPSPRTISRRLLARDTFKPAPTLNLLTRRGQIGDLMRRAWEDHGREHSATRLTPELLADVEQGATGAISAAPVLVVVAADTARALRVTVPSSIYPAIQNLLLAAGALGLGSALTTIATVFADELRDALGLPDSVLPVAVIPLGYPARPLGPPRREPFAAHTHRDQYGNPWSD
jgi:hypothetical protein